MLDVLVTTGAGNIPLGGSDIWVNIFLKEVVPYLNSDVVLYIDNKLPLGFDPKSIPVKHIITNEDERIVDLVLQKATRIHFLHNNYFERPKLWKYKDKFHTYFCHAYIQEIINTNIELGLDKIYLPTKMDLQWEQDVLKQCKKIVWIGCNDGLVESDFKNKCIRIPNYYEFVKNKPFEYNNDTIGYAARIETRKAPHYLSGKKAVVCTNKMDWENYREYFKIDSKKIKMYPYNLENHEKFFNLDFSIFHACYTNEPFGYSIFNAVDNGKLPILHSDWCTEFEYKYRASTKAEFDNVYEIIKLDSAEEKEKEFYNLKLFLQKFTIKEKWIGKIINILNDNK